MMLRHRSSRLGEHVQERRCLTADELEAARQRLASGEEDRNELPVVRELPLDVVPKRALPVDRRLEIADDAAVVVEAEPVRAGERNSKPADS